MASIDSPDAWNHIIVKLKLFNVCVLFCEAIVHMFVTMNDHRSGINSNKFADVISDVIIDIKTAMSRVISHFKMNYVCYGS